MTIQYLASFKRQFKKLPFKMQKQFKARLVLFIMDPTNSRLRIHPLKGKFAGYWSMNINGDLRAIYLNQGDSIIIFALIGTHSELYG